MNFLFCSLFLVSLISIGVGCPCADLAPKIVYHNANYVAQIKVTVEGLYEIDYVNPFKVIAAINSTLSKKDPTATKTCYHEINYGLEYLLALWCENNNLRTGSCGHIVLDPHRQAIESFQWREFPEGLRRQLSDNTFFLCHIES